jgi:LacI family transcriptional regulator
MRHLGELGHRKIAVIRGPEELFDSEPRWAGVRRAAEEAGIEIDPRLVFQLPNLTDPTSGFEGGLEFAKQILATLRPFTAVLAFDDLTALGVVRGLTEAGLRVPEDCSVVGFDDVLPAIVATPGITTIHQPLREMGLLAAQWAVQGIDAREIGKRNPARMHKALPELVVRKSTASLVSAKNRRRNKEQA